VLTVLHANDGESALLPTGDLPGAARFVADIQATRRAQQAPFAASEADLGVVTVSSGDNYLAGPRLNASLEDDDAFYDALVYTEGGFDAMTIGNHEFDFGPDLLADFIEATGDIPFISANLDFSSEPHSLRSRTTGGSPAARSSTTAGRDMGIVGATTTQLSAISSPRNVTVSEVLPAVQAEVDALRPLVSRSSCSPVTCRTSTRSSPRPACSVTSMRSSAVAVERTSATSTRHTPRTPTA
jgi:2',3'-cyclic-nucleotide 2'-phosphodiesterase (5'-nucleotidase family)